MHTFKTFCLASLATVLPAVALADISAYFGVGMGGSRVERDDINLSFDEFTTNAVGLPPYDVGTVRETRAIVDDPAGTDFAFRVFGGVRFGSYLGVEAAYLNLGEAKDGFPIILPPIFSTPTALFRPQQDRQIDVETKIDGYQLSLVGFLPLNDQIELFGRLGAVRWDRDTLIIDRIGVLRPETSQPAIPEILLTGEEPDGITFTALRNSDDGTDLAVAAGIQIKASERVSMRAEVEWLDIDGTSLTVTGMVSLVFGF